MMENHKQDFTQPAKSNLLPYSSNKYNLVLNKLGHSVKQIQNLLDV